MDIFNFKLTVKKRSHYLELYTTAFYSWALPLAVDVESSDRDYYEINIHLLCLHFAYTTTSKKWEDQNFMEELDE